MFRFLLTIIKISWSFFSHKSMFNDIQNNWIQNFFENNWLKIGFYKELTNKLLLKLNCYKRFWSGTKSFLKLHTYKKTGKCKNQWKAYIASIFPSLSRSPFLFQFFSILSKYPPKKKKKTLHLLSFNEIAYWGFLL